MTTRSYAERERETKQKRLKKTAADNTFCSPVVGNKRKDFCILSYINKTRKTRFKTSKYLPFNISAEPNHFAVDLDMVEIGFDRFIAGIAADYSQFVLCEQYLDSFDYDFVVD